MHSRTPLTETTFNDMDTIEADELASPSTYKYKYKYKYHRLFSLLKIAIETMC